MHLIVTQCFYPRLGGIEGLMTQLADSLHGAGHPVVVFADAVDGWGAAPAKPYPVHYFTGPRFWRRWKKQRAIAKFLRAQGGEMGGSKVRGGPVRGIFTCSWKSLLALPPDMSTHGFSGKIVSLAHGMEVQADYSAAKQARIRRAFARANVIVPSSNYTKKCVERYVSSSTLIKVIHPPIMPIKGAGDDVVQAIRQRLGDDAKPMILCLSRLEPRKGVDRVIAAMPALVREFPDAALAVAGGGDDRQRLEALVATLGLNRHVHFLGRVTEGEKAALMARADIFAMPVRREGQSVEGFGIAYIEAAYCGLPALAGREGGAVDAVLDGETGLIVDGADQAAVTSALLSLCRDETMRKKMGAAAEARARMMIWEQRLQDYLSLTE